MRYRIHVDGGARGNPGPAAVGISICDAESGRPVHEAGYFLGRTTNNVAEYQGLVRALTHAIQMNADGVELYSDSELMVRQLTGQYRVKSADLKPWYQKARTLIAQLGDWRIEHVRREANQRADQLANMAMDAEQDVVLVDGQVTNNE